MQAMLTPARRLFIARTGQATRLERGATNACLGVIPAFKDNKLGQVAARLAADETMHWTVLSQALGKMLPAGALSFGA